jgi:hypothetical protein
VRIGNLKHSNLLRFRVRSFYCNKRQGPTARGPRAAHSSIALCCSALSTCPSSWCGCSGRRKTVTCAAVWDRSTGLPTSPRQTSRNGNVVHTLIMPTYVDVRLLGNNALRTCRYSYIPTLREINCIHLQPWRWRRYVSSGLLLEAVCSSEMLVPVPVVWAVSLDHLDAETVGVNPA